MPANTERSRKAKDEAGLRLVKRLVRASGVMFAAVGLVMLYGARDYIPPLREPDAVLGLSTRMVLVLAGLLHLGISGGMFATRDPMMLGMVAGWAALNYVVYLAGTVWLKAAGEIPAVVVLGWELGVSAKVIEIVWCFFIVYLVTCGLLLLVLERRRLKQTQAEVFLERWGEMREDKVASAIQGDRGPVSIGHGAVTRDSSRQHPSQGEVSKNLPSEFKFSCPNCSQHIRCDRGYRGRKIACPACREQILFPTE
jgi:DNA-directed RNA polymerase subunit RPC12/RpoP